MTHLERQARLAWGSQRDSLIRFADGSVLRARVTFVNELGLRYIVPPFPEVAAVYDDVESIRLVR